MPAAPAIGPAGFPAIMTYCPTSVWRPQPLSPPIVRAGSCSPASVSSVLPPVTRLPWPWRSRGCSSAAGFAGRSCWGSPAPGWWRTRCSWSTARSTMHGSPLSSEMDWYLLAAWLLVAVYLYLAYYHPKTPFGLFLLPLALGLIGVGAALADREPFAREPASRVWGIIHGTSHPDGHRDRAAGFRGRADVPVPGPAPEAQAAAGPRPAPAQPGMAPAGQQPGPGRLDADAGRRRAVGHEPHADRLPPAPEPRCPGPIRWCWPRWACSPGCWCRS